MLLKPRFAACACFAGVLLLVAHFLSRSYPLSADSRLSSALYAAPGIAAFMLFSIAIRRPESEGVSEAFRAGGIRAVSARTVGKRPGPIAIGYDTAGWSRTGRYRANRTRRRAEEARALDCIYRASGVMAEGAGLVKSLQRVVDLIPQALRYPGVAHARITCAGMNFDTTGFIETEQRVSAGIKVGGRPVGSLRVCYATERPETGRDRFLECEKILITALAAEVGAFIEQHQARESPRLRLRV
jgi:hypothetical protein